ncbi:MAG TPA: cytochrome c [Rubricoccaceae bacterium]|jgi:cytochrome c556|nr:cytochrome c [Rubricoccaceae bacterium]
MRRTACVLLLAVTATCATGCRPQDQDADPGGEAGPAGEHDGEVHHDEGAPHDAGHDAHGGADGEALPLRPIMQQLGAAMTGFTQALWLEDYARMATFSDAIVNHPPISAEELQRIRSALGPEMDRFVAADEAVHEAALRLHEAVEARDLDAVLGRLGEVQVGCMACHAPFRERLRTDQPAP